MAKSTAPIALPYTVLCASVQTPDGFDNPTGSIIDGAVFSADLLAYYVAEGYVAEAKPIDPAVAAPPAEGK